MMQILVLAVLLVALPALAQVPKKAPAAKAQARKPKGDPRKSSMN